MRSAISDSRAGRRSADLDGAHRFRNVSSGAVNRARRPVAFAHRVQHRAPNAAAHEGLEAGAALGSKSRRGFDKSLHSGLLQIG